MSFGNLPYALRTQNENISSWAFVKLCKKDDKRVSSSWTSILGCFVHQILALQRGYELELPNGERMWVRGALGIIRADTVEGGRLVFRGSDPS